MIKRLLLGEKTAYRSPLAPDELIRRLRPEVGKVAIFAPDGIIGRVRDNGFEIRHYRRNRKNTLAPWLEARVHGDRDGSRIEGRLIPPIYVRGFLVLFTAVSVIIPVVFMVAPLEAGSSDPATAAMIRFLPLIMLLFPLTFIILGSYLWRGETERIETFLAEIVEARRQEAGAP